MSSPETRARNYGFVGVAFGLGFIFGPALGGAAGRHPPAPAVSSSRRGWPLVNWLYGFFVLPESLPPGQRSPVSWGRMNPFGSLRRLRAYPLVAGIAVVFIFASLAQRGLENVWVLHAGYRYGWDAQANGLTLALVGVMAALVQGLLVRPTVARLGERRAILFGVTLSMLAFLGYGLASAGWVVLVIIVLGSPAGVAHPTIQGLVAGAVPPSEQGKIQGALTSLISSSRRGSSATSRRIARRSTCRGRRSSSARPCSRCPWSCSCGCSAGCPNRCPPPDVPSPSRRPSRRKPSPPTAPEPPRPAVRRDPGARRPSSPW